MSKKIAIVGIFYDGYYDIWEDFLELLSIHWHDCPYPVYIVDGEKDLAFEKKYQVSVIHAGIDAEYSNKVRKAVETVDADYYLLLLEDFFIEKDIRSDLMEEIISKMEKNGIEYLRMPMGDFSGVGDSPKHAATADSASGFHFISQTSEYTVSCQPSIWKKEFLKQCIGKGNYNAWVFEGVYCTSRYAHSKRFLSRCRIDFNNLFSIRHGAVQGKMLPKVYEDFSKQNYQFKNKREILSGRSYKIYKMKQKLAAFLPHSVLQIVRRILKKKTIVEKYKPDILKVMKLNGLK